MTARLENLSFAAVGASAGNELNLFRSIPSLRWLMSGSAGSDALRVSPDFAHQRPDKCSQLASDKAALFMSANALAVPAMCSP